MIMIKWGWVYERIQKLLDKPGDSYYDGSRFIRVIQDFNPGLSDYSGYLEERRHEGKSTTRRDFFRDILEELDEGTRVRAVTSLLDELGQVASNIGTVSEIKLHLGGRTIAPMANEQIAHAKVIAEQFDAAHMRTRIERMQSAIETDPDVAIDSAKSLLETTCKTILRERVGNVRDNLDLPQLVRATQQELQLIPEDVDNAATGAESIRKVLGSLSVITGELARLRNLYGSGHGKHGRAKSLLPTHARLAVGAATTLSNFLFDSHLAKRKAGRDMLLIAWEKLIAVLRRSSRSEARVQDLWATVRTTVPTLPAHFPGVFVQARAVTGALTKGNATSLDEKRLSDLAGDVESIANFLARRLR